uniref:Fucolectin tachylectin-4 pentraxin-1 domain-containing protein n=1 Tax=Biomphalaria glabrata TaxID=6526 RepID=A0A2C9M7Q2_BIOGL
MDSTTSDYRCEINDTITRLTVRGSSLNGLCSLYISGGRNVALKQTAEQTETMGTYSASLAVDGDTNSDFQYNSCTHTTIDSALSVYPASWTLILDNPRVVNRITIFNRVDCCTERLETFSLLLLDSDNNSIWTYDNPEASVVYRLNTLQQKPVKTVRILATKNDTTFHFPILTLCEVLVFGDCELGTWGLECTSPCPIECRGLCQQETGKCYQCLGYLDPPHCST